MQYTHPPVELGHLADGTPILGLPDRDAAGTPYVVTTADGPDYHFTLDEAGWIGFHVGTLDGGDGADLADAVRLRELLTGDNLERMVAAANSYLGASLAVPGLRAETPPSYQRGLALLRDAVPLLGNKRIATLAAFMAVLVPSSIDQRLLLDMAEQYDPRPAQPAPEPEPAPRRERYPEPADFQEYTPLGEIAGATVYGRAYWCDISGRVRHYAACCELAGLRLEVDHREISILGTEVECGGDIVLSDLGALIELHQAGYLPRLIEMGRAWVALAPPDA